MKLCYEMLGKYGLPLSESKDMLSKVLEEFKGLNLGFEVRIKIEK